MKRAGFSRFVPVVGAVLLTAGGLGAGPAPAPQGEMPPPPPGKDFQKMPGRGFAGPGRGAAMWRVFSRLDEAQRRKMLDLQRSDPEKFYAEMRRLTEAYEKKEKIIRQQMQSIVDKFRASTDKEERKKLRAELAQMEKTQFAKHIAGLTSTIESAKRRLAFMEQELNKRKQKADAIVEARVEAMLNGELPVTPPPGRRRPPRHAPPPMGPLK